MSKLILMGEYKLKCPGCDNEDMIILSKEFVICGCCGDMLAVDDLIIEEIKFEVNEIE